MQENNTYSFFVGTYTGIESQGIYKYLLQKDGTLKYIGLAAISDNPSFLAMSTDRKYLLAVNEISNENGGTVESFLISGDSLMLISRRLSGGSDPCHVSVNDKGYVITANYTGGNVGLLKMNEKGELTSLLDLQIHKGYGTTDRQKSSHVHSVWFEPGSNDIISVDLGTNELWFSHLDTRLQKLLPSDPQKLSMQKGAGPRHLAFHPNGKWIYVVNELDCTVISVHMSGNVKYTKADSVSTLPVGYTEPNTSADIRISSDGLFLYVSNRGHNSIAVYSINAINGSLKLVAHQNIFGNGPRNFSLSPDEKYLLVANQFSKNIVSFRRNKKTGLLKYLHHIEAPTPVCILF